MQLLAHGALVCPECSLPIGASGRMLAAVPHRCAFCDHTAPVRDFLVEDVYDTVGNEAFLVARIV